jgi:hypothetical protein
VEARKITDLRADLEQKATGSKRERLKKTPSKGR